MASEGESDISTILKFLAEQSAKRAEEDSIRDEQRRKHEEAMYKFQENMLKLQADHDKARAEEIEIERKRQEEQQRAIQAKLDDERTTREKTEREAREEEFCERERRQTEARCEREETNKCQLRRDCPKLSEKNSIPVFLERFEELALVPKEAWSSSFQHCLSGQDLSTWSSIVKNSPGMAYADIKSQFLARSG